MKKTDLIISNDHSKLSIDIIVNLMGQSYWANQRTKATIRKSLEHSLCYGVYLNDIQIGFGRVVTDHSTMYWICDFIIDKKHRGLGYGKKLMQSIMASEELNGLMGILATKDAHRLYEQYGFQREPEKFMRLARARQ